jgi:hypothetical protein
MMNDEAAEADARSGAAAFPSFIIHYSWFMI